MRNKVTEGTSALFLLSSGAVVDKVAEAVKGQQFEVISTNLPKEQEDQSRGDFRRVINHRGSRSPDEAGNTRPAGHRIAIEQGAHSRGMRPLRVLFSGSLGELAVRR